MSNYATARMKRLDDMGCKPEQPLSIRKTVSVSENNRTYRADIDKGIQSVVYQIDGKAIIEGNKCDKLIVATKGDLGTAVFVELKGKNISHAIKQLEDTINHRLFLPTPNASENIRARIVTLNSGPTSASKMEFVKAQIRFKRQYNIDLQIRKGTAKDNPITL